MMIVAARRSLAMVFDQLQAAPKQHWLERSVVALAAVGFLGHLLLVAVVNLLPEAPATIFEGLDMSGTVILAVFGWFSSIIGRQDLSGGQRHGDQGREAHAAARLKATARITEPPT